MPLYEYYCRECDTHIERLRAAADRDAPIACPTDPVHRPKRMLSVFAVQRSERGVQVAERPAAGGGCACGGNCSCGR